jgi:hypothetical protein
MSIVDFADKLAAANRAYSDAVESIRGGLPGTYQLFTQLDGAPTGTSANIGFTDPLAPLRVHVPGESKVFDDLRAYGQTYDMRLLYKAHRIERQRVQYDTSGRVAQGLAAFVAESAILAEKRIFDLLVANTVVGIDGVTLLNDAHPYGNAGATWDNLTTDALSFSSYNAAKAAMRVFTGENGEPYDVMPTHLFVPPALERTAKEITGADRPVPFSASAQDATSSIVAATSIANAYQGDVTVVVTPRITTSTAWFLMDLSKPSARPWYAQIGPVFEQMPEINDDTVRKTDIFEYAINADMIAGPAHPQLIYGRVS